MLLADDRCIVGPQIVIAHHGVQTERYLKTRCTRRDVVEVSRIEENVVAAEEDDVRIRCGERREAFIEHLLEHRAQGSSTLGRR